MTPIKTTGSASSPPSNKPGPTSAAAPRAARAGRRDRHWPVLKCLPHRRQVRPPWHRPLGRRPPDRRGPGRCRPGSVGGPAQAELFVSGERLAEGPRQTLQTMLHKAVHGLAHARGVKDTSWGRQVPQQAGVHRPRRPAGPGQAAGAAAASGDRLLRRAADRADRGRLRRHPRLSGRGHPAVPRHPSAAWVCSVAKAKATGRTAKTTTARSHRPARPTNGSRSPAAASRPGHSGSHA
jgi:hypothetical protein